MIPQFPLSNAAFAVILFGVVSIQIYGQASTPEAQCFISMTSDLLPNGMFSQEEGDTSSMTATTVQKCGLQYPDCFQQNGVDSIDDPGFITADSSVCREVLQYKIPVQATPAPLSVIAPSEILECETDSSDPCSCQVPALSVSANLTFEVSLTTDNCCQQCSCIGDPHCTSFSGAQDSWVVCNARDANTCDVSARDCQERTWNGVPCVFQSDNKGNAACLPDPSFAVQPEMKMYSKVYVDNSTESQYSMQILLQLGNLGNIVCVTATYGPVDRSNDRDIKICTPQYGGQGIQQGISNGDWVGLDEVRELLQQTGVSAQIMIKNPGGLAERLELWIYDKDAISSISRDGFCETGVVTEKLGEDTAHCNPSDEFIHRRMCWNGLLQKKLVCTKQKTSAAQVKSGKRYWCTQTFPLKVNECMSTPWFKSVCNKLCNWDPSCYISCESRITEVPNEVILDLKRGGLFLGTRTPTVAPTACPIEQQSHPFITSNGRVGGDTIDGSPRPDAYLFVQKLIDSDTGQWSRPLLWFTKQQLLCKQTIPVTSGISQLMDPGAVYRIIQCQQQTDRCGEKVVQVNTKVTYTMPIGGGSSGGSLPMRSLYELGKLACSRTKYPTCPPEYKCCIWGPDNVSEWRRCMRINHSNFYNNPDHPCVPTWP